MKQELIHRLLRQGEELEGKYAIHVMELKGLLAWGERLAGELHTLTIVLQAMEREVELRP